MRLFADCPECKKCITINKNGTFQKHGYKRWVILSKSHKKEEQIGECKLSRKSVYKSLGT